MLLEKDQSWRKAVSDQRFWYMVNTQALHDEMVGAY